MALHLCGWRIFKFEIAGKIFYHEIGIVKDLPVDFLIGGEVMRPHAANLQFLEKGKNTISFYNAFCSVCHENFRVLRESNSFHVLSPFGRRTPTLLNALSISPPSSIDIDSVPLYAVPIAHDEHAEDRKSKLSIVLNELKIHDLNITPQLNHALLCVVDRCLDAFERMMMLAISLQ